MPAPRDPDEIAEILLYARANGMAAATARYGVHRSSIHRWRDREIHAQALARETPGSTARTSPEDRVATSDVASAATAGNRKEERTSADYVARLLRGRDHLLDRVLDMADASTSLREVAGAFKLVNDALVVEQALSEPEPDAAPAPARDKSHAT